MRMVVGSAVMMAALAVGGCGGDDGEPRATTTATAPAPRGEHVASAAEKEPLTHVVADFIYAYKEGRTGDLCALLTPAARRRLVAELRAADAALANVSSCPKMILAAYSDPSDQPDAVGQASAFRFRRVTIGGDHATIAFPRGDAWRLAKVGGHWRIAAFPFVPPSLVGGHAA